MNFKHKGFIYMVAFATIFLSACNNNEIPGLPDIDQQATYSGTDLKLYYAGQLMPAKVVELLPDDSAPGKVNLLASGVTDLSQLSSLGLKGTGAAPGIIPGSPEILLRVDLSASGDKYQFRGSGSSDFCASYQYAGFLQADSLILHIDDVKLRNEMLGGVVLKPVPFKQDGLNITSIPFYLKWELDPAAGIDIDLTGLLEALVTIPIIPTYHDTAYSSISQLLSNSLQTVAFLDNGNIVVRYFSSVGGATQLTTSIGNTLQYVVLNKQYIKLYPNPTSLFGLWLVAQSDSEGIPDISFTKPSRAENNPADNPEFRELILPLVKVLLPKLLDMTKDGIPVELSTEGDRYNVFLNTQFIVGLLQDISVNLAEHPEIVDTVLGLESNDPLILDMLSKIKELLPKLGEVLKSSTCIQIGLSFERYSD